MPREREENIERTARKFAVMLEMVESSLALVEQKSTTSDDEALRVRLWDLWIEFDEKVDD